MNPAGDFEIINVLNPSSKSDLYLVKKIGTEELYVWRTILFKTISKDKKECLCKKIRKRIQQSHVLLVKFYAAIEEDKLKLVYVPTEYFSEGSLSDFLKVLKNSETSHIPQEVIVKILFQLMVLVKSVELYDHIKLGNIYFDREFNIKFMNFSHSVSQVKIDVKMSDIGILIFQICTLTTEKLCSKFGVNNEYYSDDFIDLIEAMMKDNSQASLNFDKIITHPVIVLNTFKLSSGVDLKGCFELLDYRKKLEQLRKREAVLKLKGNKIEMKEYNLNIRQKKIIMNEKNVKDKLTQAELHLKRCKENRSSKLQNKYENVDNSLTVEYEDIEDIDVHPTSEKLDFTKFKHQPIARTLSERKVKFKGHSPLKKINFQKIKGHKKLKEREKKIMNATEMKSSLRNGKSESSTIKDVSNMDTNNKCNEEKSLAPGKYDLPDMENLQISDLQCRPIAWTQENKKQAFELLRIMNSTSDLDFWKGEVKHTFL